LRPFDFCCLTIYWLFEWLGFFIDLNKFAIFKVN
jgi:hypothetical protein